MQPHTGSQALCNVPGLYVVDSRQLSYAAKLARNAITNRTASAKETRLLCAGCEVEIRITERRLSSAVCQLCFYRLGCKVFQDRVPVRTEVDYNVLYLYITSPRKYRTFFIFYLIGL